MELSKKIFKKEGREGQDLKQAQGDEIKSEMFRKMEGNQTHMNQKKQVERKNR